MKIVFKISEVSIELLFEVVQLSLELLLFFFNSSFLLSVDSDLFVLEVVDIVLDEVVEIDVVEEGLFLFNLSLVIVDL
jgi:hypothetical protein